MGEAALNHCHGRLDHHSKHMGDQTQGGNGNWTCCMTRTGNVRLSPLEFVFPHFSASMELGMGG